MCVRDYINHLLLSGCTGQRMDDSQVTRLFEARRVCQVFILYSQLRVLSWLFFFSSFLCIWCKYTWKM